MLGGRRCTSADANRAQGLTAGGGSWANHGFTHVKKARGSASTPSGHFAEPVSLPSTASASFRLPPTTARCRFDLLAFRARRSSQSRGSKGVPQVRAGRKTRNLRTVQFSTFPQPSLQLVMKAERSGAPSELVVRLRTRRRREAGVCPIVTRPSNRYREPPARGRTGWAVTCSNLT
jgi:hypothetical protein